MKDTDSPEIGRFDKSFLIHMIRDFFLVLLAVTVLEFAIKAAMVYYSFLMDGEEASQQVADEVAENVRSIMRNEGGPVAARTIYPILEQNWSALGWKVEITPSEATTRAVEQGFGFTPRGLPVDGWPEGQFREGRVAVRGEPGCLSCHFESNVGDELGQVVVRGYLARDFAKWWDEVTLAGGMSLGKIVLHSMLLFLILRARMDPLLRLRAVVGQLARAFGGLDRRAEIRTADEFGALARDLNLFLDRITGLVRELDEVLGRVVSVNNDIVTLQEDLGQRIDTLATRTHAIERRARASGTRDPLLSQDWFNAMRGSIEALDRRLAATDGAEADQPLRDSLRRVIAAAEAQLDSTETVFAGLAELDDEVAGLRTAAARMARLEERMQGVIDTGTTLVHRLNPTTQGAAYNP